MSRKVEVELYNIDELEDDSKDKAITAWRNDLVCIDFLSDSLQFEFETLIENSEIEVSGEKIYYDLGYS